MKDIDGIYGRISKYIYDRHVLTPQAYEAAIKKALQSDILPVQVKDLFVIPDYKEFFAGCVDKNFGCAYKLDNSKLQFILEAVSAFRNTLQILTNPEVFLYRLINHRLNYYQK